MTTIKYASPSHSVDMGYIKANCSKMPTGGFWKVEKDLHVFKKAYAKGNQCIVNLIIPKGAEIYVEPYNRTDYEYDYDNRKMRASEAKVHSIFSFLDCDFYIGKQDSMNFSDIQPMKNCISSWDENFLYVEGQKVKPRNGFSRDQEQCDSGIHFFFNLCDAVSY